MTSVLTASFKPFDGSIKFFVSWEVRNPEGSGNTTIYATSDDCAREFFRYFYAGYTIREVSRKY